MKPIPVKSSRSRRSSCCCQYITITVITLCTIGFLAAVAGIIYMEFFEKKNFTSSETSENQSDLSGLVFESQERHSEVSIHVGKEKTGQKSPDKSPDSKDINNSFKKTEEHMGTNARILDTKTTVTELNQYLNNEKTKIKFQDGETVIYEVKPINSMEYEESSDALEDFKEKSLVKLNETEDYSPSYKNGSDEATTEKVDAKFGIPEMYSDSQVHKMLDVSDEVEEDSEVESKLMGDSTETSSQEVKHAVPETLVESDTHLNLRDSSKGNEHWIDTVDIGPSLGPDPEIHGVHEIQTIEENEDKVGDSQQESQLHHEVKIMPSVKYADQDVDKVLADHNVDSMIEVVDDAEDDEEFPNPFILRRNGDIMPLETTTPKLTSPTKTKAKNKQSEANEHKVFTQKQFTGNLVLPKRPMDMKVSLAEAMKHLQVLDVNNKILMSRKKTAKPKVDNTKKRKQNISRKEEDIALEKEKYLQKVRLMLYERFQ